MSNCVHPRSQYVTNGERFYCASCGTDLDQYTGQALVPPKRIKLALRVLATFGEERWVQVKEEDWIMPGTRVCWVTVDEEEVV